METTSKNKIEQSNFLKALRREPVETTPVWLMRQAGRYQSEYREIRSRVSFLELCRTPELAAEVTCFAVRQLDVDAAIIFADILLVLDVLELGLRFEKSEGPVIDKPIAGIQDVDCLPEFDPESLGYVGNAIGLVVEELKETPVIGFAGAPFTVASYAIEGGSSRSFQKTKTFMYRQPEVFSQLMAKLTDVTASYLKMQIRSGASALQIFDSWVGNLSPIDYERLVLPHMRRLIKSIGGAVPVIYFGTTTAGLLPLMSSTGADTIGVDWRIFIDEAWKLIGNRGIQGNLDPQVLFADREEIRRQTVDILKRVSGKPGHVFNLGHGILPDTPVDNVKYLVELVREFSVK